MFDIFHKCGLISEFIFYSPKNVPNKSSKREDAQDSDMAHFLVDGGEVKNILRSSHL